jgi:hypothetical protein
MVPRGPPRVRGVGCIHSLGESGLAAWQGGLWQLGGGLRVFVGVGLTRSLPSFPGVAVA